MFIEFVKQIQYTNFGFKFTFLATFNQVDGQVFIVFIIKTK